MGNVLGTPTIQETLSPPGAPCKTVSESGLPVLSSPTCLETLHNVNYGDLKLVFYAKAGFLTKNINHILKGLLDLTRPKHIFLDGLSKLQHTCEAKMCAPKLETIKLRGCWRLRRLTAIGRSRRPTLDCERELWEKLERDGIELGHCPSLLKPFHSSY